MAFHIHIYHKDGLSYGGSEEGGWWYETFSFEMTICRRFSRMDDAVKAVGRVNKLLTRLADRGRVPPVSSMTYGGGRYCAVITATSEIPAANLPLERPYYS